MMYRTEVDQQQAYDAARRDARDVFEAHVHDGADAVVTQTLRSPLCNYSLTVSDWLTEMTDRNARALLLKACAAAMWSDEVNTIALLQDFIRACAELQAQDKLERDLDSWRHE